LFYSLEFYIFTTMKVIYSVITGGYDELPIAPYFDGWDSIMFTDKQHDDNKGWKIIQLPKSNNPLIQSRDIKIRPHIHLPEYDLVCYVDGNQKFIKEPPSNPIWFEHQRRTNIFQEAQQIINNGRFPDDIINEQIDYYTTQGYEDCGLYLNGFSVRNNKNEDIKRLNDVWFEETCKFAPRDQLSLPYAIWKTGIKPTNIRSGFDQRYTIITKGHKQDYYANN